MTNTIKNGSTKKRRVSATPADGKPKCIRKAKTALSLASYQRYGAGHGVCKPSGRSKRRGRRNARLFHAASLIYHTRRLGIESTTGAMSPKVIEYHQPISKETAAKLDPSIVKSWSDAVPR